MTPMLAQVAALFTAPALAAAGAAAVAVPVAIHLLWRYRRRPEPWGAMRFLMEAYRRHRSRLRFEQLLLLAVRCLIVLLLGLALAGPVLDAGALSFSGLTGGRARTVHLVMDDDLTSRATALAGEARFERLREQALALVDAASAEDRFTVWRASQPAEAVIASPTTERAAVRAAIEQLRPRHSGSEVPAALSGVADSIGADGQGGTEDHVVVVLSDFAQSATYLDEPAASALRELGQRAAVWSSRPAPGAGNVQIESLTPGRRMVLADSLAAAAPVEVRLRRFDEELGEATLGVTVSVLDDAGDAVASLQREQRFAAGQAQATLNVALPLNEVAQQLDRGPRLLSLRAQLDAAQHANALTEDDVRYALVELRSELNVGLVDQTDAAGDGESLRPAQWLALVLQPQEGGREVISARLVSPEQVDDAALSELDAVMVLRPDLLEDGAWQRLAGFGQRGGVVWLFTPPTDAPAAWASAMQRAFEVEWRVGLEPLVTEHAAGAAVDADAAVPEALSLLSADWAGLLRPVRVQRFLPIEQGGDDAWLRVQSDEGPQPFLVTSAVGEGHVVLLTTALDAAWTNLPTRPLFVPLVHETLRGLLGAAGARVPEEVTSGERPMLSNAWRGASALAQSGEGAARVSLRQVEDRAGVQPTSPLDEPGVYTAVGSATALKLAVNVDAEAGNLQTVSEERVARWLGAMGPFEFLDEQNPAAVFAQAADVMRLGWPLLWVVLALVILETVLARYLAHARQVGQRSVGDHLRAIFDQLRGAAAPATAEGGAR